MSTTLVSEKYAVRHQKKLSRKNKKNVVKKNKKKHTFFRSTHYFSWSLQSSLLVVSHPVVSHPLPVVPHPADLRPLRLIWFLPTEPILGAQEVSHLPERHEIYACWGVTVIVLAVVLAVVTTIVLGRFAAFCVVVGTWWW